VTSSHLKEFLLLKFSAELFYKCVWYLSCDQESYQKLREFQNCKCENLELKNGKVFGNDAEIDNFYGVINGKFRASERALKENKACLLVDSDIIFCGEVDGLEKNIDAAICPHYQWNPTMDSAWGIYNVGFVYIKNIEFLKEWERQTQNGTHGFEQVPIQEVIASATFNVQIFPIQHNMGWWRFNSSEKRFRVNSFECSDDRIWFDGNKVSSFHFHSFVECHHSVILKDFVFEHLLPKTASGIKILTEYNKLK